MQKEEGKEGVWNGELCNCRAGCGVGVSGFWEARAQPSQEQVVPQPLRHWQLPRLVPVIFQGTAAQEWREFRIPGFARSKRLKIQNLGPEQLLRAQLLVCVSPWNAARTSKSYVGLLLLHSCPVLQRVWGKVVRKVTSKDTFPSWRPWACKKSQRKKVSERGSIKSHYSGALGRVHTTQENPVLNLQEFCEPIVKHGH